MVEDLFLEIAILVFILLVIGIAMTIYEFRNNVFPKKEPKGKRTIARKLDV